MSFYIDDVEQSGKISGITDWAVMTFQIPEGTHTLKWVYSKDSSVSSGGDSGWVDSIVWEPDQNQTQPGGTSAMPAIINLLLDNQ